MPRLASVGASVNVGVGVSGSVGVISTTSGRNTPSSGSVGETASE
jgi:hypothetical protein